MAAGSPLVMGNPTLKRGWRRAVLAGATMLTSAGCGTSDSLSPADLLTIAGEYRLQEVDGENLPCCATTDSTGARVTVVGGLLTLASAAPEAYVYTPAGIPMARTCVHEVPDGAMVDSRTGVVTLKDGTSYRIPPCGDGDYTLILTRLYRAAGLERVVAETTAARYTWGYEPGGGGILSLLGGGPAAGLGTITWTAGGVELSVDMGVRVGPFPPLGPRYRFQRSRH